MADLSFHITIYPNQGVSQASLDDIERNINTVCGKRVGLSTSSSKISVGLGMTVKIEGDGLKDSAEALFQELGADEMDNPCDYHCSVKVWGEQITEEAMQLIQFLIQMENLFLDLTTVNQINEAQLFQIAECKSAKAEICIAYEIIVGDRAESESQDVDSDVGDYAEPEIDSADTVLKLFSYYSLRGKEDVPKLLRDSYNDGEFPVEVVEDAKSPHAVLRYMVQALRNLGSEHQIYKQLLDMQTELQSNSAHSEVLRDINLLSYYELLRAIYISGGGAPNTLAIHPLLPMNIGIWQDLQKAASREQNPCKFEFTECWFKKLWVYEQRYFVIKALSYASSELLTFQYDDRQTVALTFNEIQKISSQIPAQERTLYQLELKYLDDDVVATKDVVAHLQLVALSSADIHTKKTKVLSVFDSYKNKMSLAQVLQLFHEAYSPNGSLHFIRKERGLFRYGYGNTVTWKVFLSTLKDQLFVARVNALTHEDQHCEELTLAEYSQLRKLLRTHTNRLHYPKSATTGKGLQPCDKTEGVVVVELTSCSDHNVTISARHADNYGEHTPLGTAIRSDIMLPTQDAGPIDDYDGFFQLRVPSHATRLTIKSRDVVFASLNSYFKGTADDLDDEREWGIALPSRVDQEHSGTFQGQTPGVWSLPFGGDTKDRIAIHINENDYLYITIAEMAQSKGRFEIDLSFQSQQGAPGIDMPDVSKVEFAWSKRKEMWRLASLELAIQNKEEPGTLEPYYDSGHDDDFGM